VPGTDDPGVVGAAFDPHPAGVSGHRMGNTRRFGFEVDNASAEGRCPVGVGEFDTAGESRSLVRRRTYEAVSAVVSDDHCYERGVQAARAIVDSVLAECGPAGLAEMAVELSSQLAEAVECVAGERGVAATDLIDVLFVD